MEPTGVHLQRVHLVQFEFEFVQRTSCVVAYWVATQAVNLKKRRQAEVVRTGPAPLERRRGCLWDDAKGSGWCCTRTWVQGVVFERERSHSGVIRAILLGELLRKRPDSIVSLVYVMIRSRLGFFWLFGFCLWMISIGSPDWCGWLANVVVLPTELGDWH